MESTIRESDLRGHGDAGAEGFARRILFPTDFSGPATAAWPYAVGVARRGGGALHLLHVVTPPLVEASGEGMLLPWAGLVDHVLAEAQGVLDELARSARALGIPTVTHTRSGEAASEIVACATAERIDLIAMATTGRTGLAHVALGSVAERVVRHAGCPVLTVRHDPSPAPARLTLGTLPRIQHILVPLDGSPLAEAALPSLIGLAKRHGAALRLLRVVHVNALRETGLAAAQIRVVHEAEAYLEGVARQLAANGVPVTPVVRYGETPEEILEDIRVQRPDLVAMSTHGRTGLSHLVLGSVAEQVLRASPEPVLLFPARARGEVRRIAYKSRRLTGKEAASRKASWRG